MFVFTDLFSDYEVMLNLSDPLSIILFASEASSTFSKLLLSETYDFLFDKFELLRLNSWFGNSSLLEFMLTNLIMFYNYSFFES